MEWVLVLIVVVVVFFGGAKVIPQIAKSVGRARGEYERGKLEVERALAAERQSAVAPPSCEKCGAHRGEADVKCLKCGSARDRPALSASLAQTAR
jgi:sec-independent protein translocase protein TatA